MPWGTVAKTNLQMGSKLLALSEHGQYEIRYMNCVTWISSPSSGEPSGQTRGLEEYNVYCIVVGQNEEGAEAKDESCDPL